MSSTEASRSVPAPDSGVRRELDLDVGADELWNLISTAEGWRQWLVDDIDVAVTPGQRGTATDDGRSRQVAIDTVTPGERITFTWWDQDDAGAASVVEIGIGSVANGRRRLSITERPLTSPAPHAAMGAVMTNEMVASCDLASGVGVRVIRWEVRAVSIWALTVRCAVRT